jgi:hypothetical protein
MKSFNDMIPPEVVAEIEKEIQKEIPDSVAARVFMSEQKAFTESELRYIPNNVIWKMAINLRLAIRVAAMLLDLAVRTTEDKDAGKGVEGKGTEEVGISSGVAVASEHSKAVARG